MQYLSGNNWIIYSGIVVDHVKKHSRVEIYKISKLMTLNLELIFDVAFYVVEESQFQRFANPIILLVLVSLKIVRE